ncbi:MAG: endolytic transglycosylase MltG [Silicimonas sp.]|nr:endolytic transglycosylase MltG [Silicimonas sp.]NND21406.1 endolytic transglycosylase MltG [Silicimonas sp.]
MWRNIASNFLTVLIVVLIGLAVAIGWGQRQYVAEGPLEEAICLQVPRGGSMSRVADDLASRGAITSATIYRLGSEYADKSKELKAGSFLIREGASMAEIVDEITGEGRSTCGTQVIHLVRVGGQETRVRELNPETQEFEVTAEFDPAVDDFPDVYLAARDEPGTEFLVTVVEGVTSWQVVEALKASDLFEGEVAEVPAEGTLAPDGYEIRPGQDREEFLASMAAIQEIRLTEAWESRAEDAPVGTPEEALILASIIEKETAIPDERRLVASVFANRLEQGIRLQTDPTVIYGVTEGKGVLGRGLRQSELRRETPWNTYVIDGLPPTPIANPGRASIEAALDPEESEFVYFVAKTLDPKDGHVFAATLDEHNENVAAYRALERAAE